MILVLKYTSDIFCKCDPVLNRLIPVELVKVIIERHKNKGVFLTRLLDMSGDEDYTIELLKIFESYNIMYRTSKFISDLQLRVLEYIIDKTQRDLIFNLGDRYFHPIEVLQKIADIDSDSINYSRKFFTLKVDEILMSLAIKKDCKYICYNDTWKAMRDKP